MSDVTKITVNGCSYDSVEQMSPEVREEYVRTLAALREAGAGETSGDVNKKIAHSLVKETFVFNGRESQSRDELPPEVRSMLEQMPPPSPADQTTNVEIKTVRTFKPRVRVTGQLLDEGEGPLESKPDAAWLLVKILVVVILVLLGLIYWMSVRFKR